MICARCGEDNHKVGDVRNLKDGRIRRHRYCMTCDYDWFTIEKEDKPDIYNIDTQNLSVPHQKTA